ncbi:MAG: NAD(P)-binding domain-containing protein [Rhizobiales bacterium]|nr:NAD(P)-binding domain-containing protein [Hyphomicrobiales bacterium]
MANSQTIGVVGGSGQLGGAIARAWLRSGCVAPEQLWISNRSGTAAGFEEWSGIKFTTCNQDLVDACQVVLLSVPPHLVSTLDINAKDRLVMSVMAGVSINLIRQQTQATRIVRAMSNPAADIGLAYSPWCAGIEVTDEDRRSVHILFEACGETDEVPNEEQIDRFTALTGPVPGFVAFYADCMVQYAVKHGIDAAVANRAVRQLFQASGTVLGSSPTPPAEHVNDMIAYAGTTAAGLEAMKVSALADCIEEGLDAAYERVKSIAPS